MKRNTWKLLIDVIMIILFLIMYKKRIISVGFHEIIGLLIFLIVLIHLFFNRKLFITATKKFGKIKTKTKLRYIVDLALLIDFILMIITGIMISKVLFNFGYFGIWKFIHNFLCGFALILVGIHCGIEWDTFYAMIRKIIKIPKNIAKPLGIIFAILILVGGAYSMVNTPFGEWLTGPFTYDPSNTHGDGHGDGLSLGKGNNGTGQGINSDNGTGEGLGNNGTAQHLNQNGTGQGTGSGDGTGQGKHDGSGKGLHKNSNGTGQGLGNNGTAQHKNQNKTINQSDNNTGLINYESLNFNTIFNSGNINYVSMIIVILEIGSIIGFFGIITRLIELGIRKLK